MYRPLRGKDCLDWIILREAFDHFAAGTGLQEGQLRSRLGAEEYIDIRKNRENRLPRLIPGPEITAEIDIEGNQCTGFLKPSDGFNGCLPKLRRKCQRDAGGMEAFGALKYLRIDILHPEGEKARIPAVIDDLRLPRVGAVLIKVNAKTRIRILIINKEIIGDTIRTDRATHELAVFIGRNLRDDTGMKAEKRCTDGDIQLGTADVFLENSGTRDTGVARRGQTKQELPHGDKIKRTIQKIHTTLLSNTNAET